MRFSCTQENLHRGLSLVSHVASRASTLPILTNILFEVSGSSITFSATNLEIGIRATIHGKVEREGKIIVPAKLINECVALLPKENITITLEGATLRIQSKSYDNKIHTLSPEDFPLLPTVEEQMAVTVAPTVLAQVLHATLFTVSYDDTRPELSGVFFATHKKQLIVAATDGYRLAERRATLENTTQDITGVILPLRTMQEVSRALSILPAGEDSELVKIAIATHQVSFHMCDTVIISRLIDGQYPQYRDIIPQGHESSAVVERDIFEQALKAASLFSMTGINEISLTLLPSEGGIRVRAANIHVGENITVVPATVTGKEVELVVNWRYLSEGLQSFSTDTVQLEVTNNTTPLILRPKGVEGHLYLVMPIRQ